MLIIKGKVYIWICAKLPFFKRANMHSVPKLKMEIIQGNKDTYVLP